MTRSPNGRLAGLLGRTQALGRMSLTIYIAESLIASLIFNGYGLGLFGEVGPAAGLAIAIGVWLALVPCAQLWFRRFRFGPLEWALRSWTYGSVQPMRAQRPAS